MGASLMESHSMANSQFNFFHSAHPPLLPSPPSPLSCLPAWLGNWISVVSQGSALWELSGRSEVAGQHCVTANLSLDRENLQCVCRHMRQGVSTYKALCECVRWGSSSLCSPSIGGWREREDASRERQKQIFCLSHLLGGDPEEASLHGLQKAMKRKLTHRQALPSLT